MRALSPRKDKYGAVVARGKTAENGVLELTVLNPVLWNAENPYLYQVILTMPDEVIVDRIGFRTIVIKDKVIYFNGEKIKFRGVNRHDSDPETGFVIDARQIKKDLMLMKQHNFNAIRSSHYPNAPYFYQMCDEYGFMVIDEADIEAHGPFMLYRKEDTDQNRFRRWNEKIADDPAWEKAIVDRVQLMVQRDKNRPSIVMWSMGNESAYGCNFEKALAWTKKFDPDRITQYESARYRNYDITYDYDNLDLYSRMYPSLQEIEDYLKKDGSKPFLLVEYCHSMGNGPGDFEDYFQMIHKDDRMCGGFVWEWCDHAIAHGTAENGKTRYYYGGDHGETIHDGNFCMDGLVYPDRTPHTGLLEYKNVYRPVRIVSYDQENGQMVLHNYMDFDDLKDYVDIFYEMTQDGLTVEKGKLVNVVALPHSDAEVELKLQVPNTGKIYLKLIYRLKKEMPLLEQGYELGLRGYILAVIGRALVVVAGYMGSIPLMMAFTALAALGQGPWQGDMNAVIASCSEYTYLTQGKRVDGTMYSCTSLGVKIGGGIGTAVVGWLLELSGYVGTHAVQPQSALNMMQFMYLWLPLIFDVLIMFILSRMNVEETNAKIKKEKGITVEAAQQ